MNLLSQPPWANPRDSEPIVASHRAGGNEAPENTIAAIRHAQQVGSKVLQLDVLQTSDGVPVIFHDKSLKRATGLDQDIRQVTYKELPPYLEVLQPLLQTGDVPPIITSNFKDGRLIPTVEEALAEIGPDTSVMLEFWDDNKALIDDTAELVRKAGLENRVIVGNPFNENTLRLCRVAFPNSPALLPSTKVLSLVVLFWLGLVSFWSPPAHPYVFNVALFTGWEKFLFKFKPGIKGWIQRLKLWRLILLKYLVQQPKLFRWLKEQGVPVIVFILNRPQDWDAALKLKGIDAIQTDAPEALANCLTRRS